MSLEINLIKEIPVWSLMGYGGLASSVGKIDSETYIIGRVGKEFHLFKKDDNTKKFLMRFCRKSDIIDDRAIFIDNSIKNVFITKTGNICVVCKKNITLFELHDDKCEFIMTLNGKFRNGVFSSDDSSITESLANDLLLYGIDHNLVFHDASNTKLTLECEYDGFDAKVFTHHNFAMLFAGGNVETHTFSKDDQLIYNNKKRSGFVLTRNKSDFILRSINEIKQHMESIIAENGDELYSTHVCNNRFIIFHGCDVDLTHYSNYIYLYDIVTSNAYIFKVREHSCIDPINNSNGECIGFCIDNDFYIIKNGLLNEININGKSIMLMDMDCNSPIFDIVDETIYYISSKYSIDCDDPK